MKREEVKAIFPDATDEQLNKIMGINGSDIEKAKADTETLKGQLKEAQTALAEAKKGGGEELTKAQTEIGKLQKELGDLKTANAVRETREKVAKEKGIPPELLTGDTEEACAAQADSILAFAKPGAYPVLPNPGESHGTPNQPSTDQQFAEWAQAQFS